MKTNFSTIIDGKEYWISRSVAVLAIVLCKIHGKWHVLANQRGKGTPDFHGYWNMPCGYLDYGETCKQAAVREVWEECGVKLSLDRVYFCSYNDNPSEARQNVTLRFISTLDERKDKVSVGTGVNNRGGEVDEVEAISWIPISEVDSQKWAFGHETIIKDLSHEFIDE